MRGSGGTEAFRQVRIGFCLSALAAYLFFDSVRVTTAGHGLISGLFGYGQGGYWETTLTGIIFVPFFLGVVVLVLRCSLVVGLGADVPRHRYRGHRDSQPHPVPVPNENHAPAGDDRPLCGRPGLMLRSYRDDGPGKDQAEEKDEPF